MGVAVFFLWLGCVLCAVQAAIGPRRLYWAVRAPMLRNPQANEPSDAAYGLQRGAAVVGAVLLGLAAVATTVSLAAPLDEQGVYRVASDVAAEVDEYDSVLGPSIESGIRSHSDGGKVEVRRVSDGDVEQYEITNEDGDFPVCLSVEEVESGAELGDPDFSFLPEGWDASVVSGAC